MASLACMTLVLLLGSLTVLAEEHINAEVQEFLGIICAHYPLECDNALMAVVGEQRFPPFMQGRQHAEAQGETAEAKEKRHRGMIRFGKRKSAYFRFGRSAPDSDGEGELQEGISSFIY